MVLRISSWCAVVIKSCKGLCSCAMLLIGVFTLFISHRHRRRFHLSRQITFCDCFCRDPVSLANGKRNNQLVHLIYEHGSINEMKIYVFLDATWILVFIPLSCSLDEQDDSALFKESGDLRFMIGKKKSSQGLALAQGMISFSNY